MQPIKDTDEYYTYWENRGYEFVEGRTIDSKTGFTKFIWVKRKKININTTIVKGIVCIKCGVTLPDMLMSEHLDITNPKNKMCGCI